MNLHLFIDDNSSKNNDNLTVSTLDAIITGIKNKKYASIFKEPV